MYMYKGGYEKKELVFGGIVWSAVLIYREQCKCGNTEKKIFYVLKWMLKYFFLSFGTKVICSLGVGIHILTSEIKFGGSELKDNDFKTMRHD